jgi:hypothetical protein
MEYFHSLLPATNTEECLVQLNSQVLDELEDVPGTPPQLAPLSRTIWRWICRFFAANKGSGSFSRLFCIGSGTVYVKRSSMETISLTHT